MKWFKCETTDMKVNITSNFFVVAVASVGSLHPNPLTSFSTDPQFSVTTSIQYNVIRWAQEILSARISNYTT